MNMKNASHLLRCLYHFLCAEDGVTTESFSVRVRLLFLTLSENSVVIVFNCKFETFSKCLLFCSSCRVTHSSQALSLLPRSIRKLDLFSPPHRFLFPNHLQNNL